MFCVCQYLVLLYHTICKAEAKIYISYRLFVLFQLYDNMWAKLQRAFAIWSGFGMTLTGVHTCGDYMFSGHTVVLTMLNFFVTECKSFVLE